MDMCRVWDATVQGCGLPVEGGLERKECAALCAGERKAVGAGGLMRHRKNNM